MPVGLQIALGVSIGLWIFLFLVVPFYERRRLNRLREHALNLHANAQIELDKRANVMRQLVAIASQYTREHRAHEADVFKGVTQPSAAWMNSGLAFVSNTAQQFPALQANTSYVTLMSELSSGAERAQHKMEAFNTAARTFNVERGFLPALFGMQREFPGLEYLGSEQLMIPASAPHLRSYVGAASRSAEVTHR